MINGMRRRLMALEAVVPQSTAWWDLTALSEDDLHFLSVIADQEVDTDEKPTSDERARLRAISDRITRAERPADGDLPSGWIAR